MGVGRMKLFESLKNLLNRDKEEVKAVAEEEVVQSASTFIVVGDRGTGKTYFVNRMVQGRRTLVFSRLSSVKGAKRTIRVEEVERARPQVIVVEDLPAFKELGDLATIVALQRHLGVEESYITTQLVEKVDKEVFRQATHLVVFRSSLSVQKLASWLNDYRLAQKVAEKAVNLKERQLFLVDLRAKKVSRVFVNDNVEEIRKWIESPIETVEVAENNVEEVEVEVHKLSVRQQILRLKRADPSLDHYQIASILGITPNHAKKELSTLRRAGLIA